MSETIFHLDSTGNLTTLNESTYISEDLLQKLLADYPALISGSQINSSSPRRWLLISREFKVPDEKDASGRWSLDHLFIDQDGIPTLVEVKRSTDTRIRREVIGQILDYAANAVLYWTIEEIIYRFEDQCKTSNKEAALVLEDFLQGENEADNFWEVVRTNLKAGKIRMLIISDTIPKELKRIIEFLNEQMTPSEILGLEIKQFIGEGNIKTLVPRIIGHTATAENTKSIKSIARNWDEETFFEELGKKCTLEEIQVVKKLYAWAKTNCSIIKFGDGKKMGSVYFKLLHAGFEHFMFGLWTYSTLEILFQYYKDSIPFNSEQKRLELLERLNKIKGLNIPINKVSTRPNIPYKLLIDEEEFQKFINTSEWYLNEIKVST